MPDPFQLFSIEEFERVHVISRSQIYREIKAGRLIASKVGSRTVVTAENAASWRAALPALPPTSAPNAHGTAR